jgi:CRISPR-associated exonuclease Cas4
MRFFASLRMTELVIFILLQEALLIKENYNREVKKGFICYIRSKNLLKEIQITAMDFTELQSMIAEIIDVTQKGYYPKGTKYKAQCIDCCYRNICV